MNTVKKLIGIALGFSIFLFSAQSKALTLDAAWSHGNAASLQTPTSVTMNKFGWGAVYNLPVAASAWTHITLPTPVIDNGVRSKLYKVLVQYNGNAVIDKVDVWDGPNRIGTLPVFWTGNHLAFGNWGTIYIPNFPQILYGVSVSLHVKNSSFYPFFFPQSMNIVSVGGDFYN
ncbi:exported hypothetical protein [Candidatus Methylobacter favarea]|uniref:Uncharacterized protein n=1 Tax=Candidatus Methylobacter favarea TaxID=2707345 RepID=A0A8S0WRY7_9GAMM|nr:DUF6623 family protein [Candidatus Methylobacter favarea]CAA9892361.1 exported hypothetical protein [Candidatus Methylobacter favarea]